MDRASRQAKLVEIVRAREKASVGALAEALGASKETIRRDLTGLARAGTIQKVHGGAIIARHAGEGAFAQRLSQNVDAKTRIAKLAAALVRPGETLFVDTGSTTLLFAEALAAAGVPGLTIVTNATEIARTMARPPVTPPASGPAGSPGAARVFLLGGAYGLDNSQTLGAMALAQIAGFRAHHAFLTIGALDLKSGAMDFNIDEAAVARAMIGQSERVTLLADGSKLGALASFPICPPGRIDRLVTDRAPAAGLLEGLRGLGCEVIFPPQS